MGMFDTLVGADGVGYQTKALRRLLDRFAVGDQIPGAHPGNHQIEVLGGPVRGERSFASVRGGVLVDVPVTRDESLPLLGYFGEWGLPILKENE